MSAPEFILASGSQVRQTVLRAAGVPFEARPAAIDEESVIESAVAAGHPPRDIAQTLADMKALRVAMDAGDALVLGADQVLVCDGTLYMKPEGREGARERLKLLRGRDHELVCAMSIARADGIIWRHCQVSKLRMRQFSDDWLEGYLDRTMPDILSSVGAYQVEFEGVQLFSRIDGDHFSVLGLPLLPLMSFLRDHGVLET